MHYKLPSSNHANYTSFQKPISRSVLSCHHPTTWLRPFSTKHIRFSKFWRPVIDQLHQLHQFSKTYIEIGAVLPSFNYMTTAIFDKTYQIFKILVTSHRSTTSITPVFKNLYWDWCCLAIIQLHDYGHFRQNISDFQNFDDQSEANYIDYTSFQKPILRSCCPAIIQLHDYRHFSQNISNFQHLGDKL